ncbi:protein of unknown function [Pustulibacterium marinum]|uniref:Bacteroides conjugative transposon TraN protein n=1 Tax=Pustulibacterium marinum TaxID=1224947 RepID=A0A1I7HU74_9FLAO|nr:DUF4138 domain-containing protein [Pustulibacterium marinum]SFU64056.1 protein of unknown function [Pustulibacterium marinum]
MKNYLKILLGMIGMGSALQAQATEKIDTLFVNAHQVVMLVFPEPIRQAVVGDAHFVFTYNKESGQYMGLVQGTEGVESNLFVITTSGTIYSYTLAYKGQLEQTYYKVLEPEHIGKEKQPDLKVQTFEHGVSRSEVKKYDSTCERLLQYHAGKVKTRRRKKLRLRLEELKYVGEEMYLVISLKNKSEIDFKVGDVRVFVSRGRKGKKSSYQELELPVSYRYLEPETVVAGGESRWVLVLPKTVLGAHEELQLEVGEVMGNRSMKITF